MPLSADSGSLYTNEIRQFINTRDWPKGALIQVVEFDDCLRLKMFRDNINSLSGEVQRRLATVLNETLTTIQNSGVPIYTWVVRGNGNDQGT